MTELKVLEKETALSVLTGDNGVGLLIDHVRDQVMSLEGGNLKTKAGRKVIKSNAFKATKAKTNANKVIDELIQQNKDSIELKTKVEVATIEKLKQSKKDLGAGLDKIRADVNAEVQKIEDDIQAEQDRIMAEEEEERRRVEIENCLELAHYMNADFDKSKAEAAEAERLERIEYEERLKLEAAEQAKLQAEQDAKAERERVEREKQEAIDNEIKAKAKLKAQKLAAKQAAEQAEARRLADIEQAKVDAANAQRAIEDAAEAERIRKELNKRHCGKIHSQMKQDFINVGMSEECATLAVKALANKAISFTVINY